MSPFVSRKGFLERFAVRRRNGFIVPNCKQLCSPNILSVFFYCLKLSKSSQIFALAKRGLSVDAGMSDINPPESKFYVSNNGWACREEPQNLVKQIDDINFDKAFNLGITFAFYQIKFIVHRLPFERWKRFVDGNRFPQSALRKLCLANSGETLVELFCVH